MKRLGLLVFGAAFATSLLGAGSGCVQDECECPSTPLRPEGQGPLTGLTVSSYDDQGETAVSFVQPENGTLEVMPSEVAIAYEQEGVTHHITYTVVPTH